jgi:hypothetical protein
MILFSAQRETNRKATTAQSGKVLYEIYGSVVAYK